MERFREIVVIKSHSSEHLEEHKISIFFKNRKKSFHLQPYSLFFPYHCYIQYYIETNVKAFLKW